MEKKTVYAFVGIPSQGSMYSQVVEGTDSDIEREIDDMMDVLDCQRRMSGVWMTICVESASFAVAAERLVHYMQFKRDKSEGLNGVDT